MKHSTSPSRLSTIFRAIHCAKCRLRVYYGENDEIMSIIKGGVRIYTVMIAEDELLVRMGLIASVMWEKLDMQLVADASDGTRALELYLEKKPDILITDLSMPGLDGLSLIREIRAQGTRCAIIVVTCLDRFELLYQAMELGVSSYLLKVTMTMPEIEQALCKARDSLGAPGSTSAADATAAAQSAFESYLFTPSFTLPKLTAHAEQHGFHVLPHYCLCCLHIHQHQKLSWQLQNALQSMLTDRLRGQHVLYIVQQGADMVALFTRTPKVHEMNCLCESLCTYLNDHFNLQLTLGITSEAISTELLPTCLHRILSTYTAPIHQGYAILWYDTQGRLENQQFCSELMHLREQLWQVQDYCFMLNLIRRTYLLESLSFSTPEQCCAAILQLAQEIEAHPGFRSESTIEILHQPDVLHSPISLIQALALHIIPHLPRYRSEICTVIRFIVRNPSGALSLREAASLAALHPQYLSNLFKKEVGITFSDFVCTVRLLNAQQLLRDSSKSVQAVADSLGFSDQAYFCRKFKQLTGKTPAQWRRSATSGAQTI